MKITQFGKKQMWRVLMVVSAFLLTLCVAVMVIMTQNSTFINGALGITGTKTVEVGENEEIDKLYVKSDFESLDELYAHNKKVARDLEAEGAVLLKNDSALPLDKGAKVSCFSRSSVDVAYGGTGGGSVNAAVTVTMKQAFESDAKMSVNPTLWQAYLDYTSTMPQKTRVKSSFTGAASFWLLEAPMTVYNETVRGSYAAYGDAAIVMITRVGGEGADLTPGKFTDGDKYLALQDIEKDLLKEAKAHFDKVIVLINSSNAMELDWLDDPDYGVDAALWIGGPGQEGLYAVADILVGNTNPSGRLVNIYAADSVSSPASQNFGDFTFANEAALDSALAEMYGKDQAGRYNKYLVYQEGIYVGYKYYETRYEDCILGGAGASSEIGAFASSGNWNYAEEVTYPFGYGLSYTNFSQTLDDVRETEGGFEVIVTVKNESTRAGKSVVQIYAQSEYTRFDATNGLEKPSVQLVGFGKTKELAPKGKAGDSETLTLTVDKYDLAIYDNVINKGYILEAGDYYIAIGDDSHDALNNILAAKGKSGMYDADGKAVGGNAKKAHKWVLSETDTKSFMYSDITKNKITNRFDDLDLQHYGKDLVEYTTRNDWTTFPDPQNGLTATAGMIEDLKFTYKESGNTDTSMFKTEQKNNLTLVSMRGADFADPHWEQLIDQMSMDDLMIAVAKACKEEILSVNKPLNYLKDGPQAITGNVSSGGGLYYSDYVGNCMLDTDKPNEDNPTVAYTSQVVVASTWNLELIEELGRAFGEDGLWSLVHHHYAPGANIHRTPYSGRNFEYYSEDGFMSGTMAAAEVKGQRSKGLITYIKHFLLNDQETNRTGVSTFVDEQTFREIYLRGFEYAFTKYWDEGLSTNAVMGGFNRIGCVWTGAHKGLMTDLLVGEWGFNGITDTDFALWAHMEARSGVMAGTTDFAVTSDARSSEILKSIATDADLYKAVRAAAHRNLYVIANSAEMNGYTPNTRIVRVLTPYQIALIIAIVLIGVLFVGSTGMLALRTYKKEEI